MRKISAIFLLVSTFGPEASAQELPPWKTFTWDNSGAYFDALMGHFCTEIPTPPVYWIPDCSIRATESGDFLIYNQLMKEREAFGYEPLPEAPVITDTNYMAYRA